MALCPSGSSGHRVRYDGHGVYVLSWRTHSKSGRLLRLIVHTRDTNRKGAERFHRRWRLAGGG